MTRHLSKILAVVLLVAVVMGLWFLIADPLWQSVADAREDMEQYYARIDTQNEIEKRSAENRTMLDGIPPGIVDDRIYVQPTMAGAEALFQRDVKAVLADAGVMLNSMQGQQLRSNGVLKPISVRLDVQGTTDQLAKLLASLHSHDKMMNVIKASIRVRTEESPAAPANLGILLEVEGLARN